MTPLLTIWNAKETRELEVKVNSGMAELYPEETNLYASIQTDNTEKESLADKISVQFNRLIRLTAVDSELHIVYLTPLCSDSFEEDLKKVVGACGILRHRISLHTIAFRDSLWSLFGKTDDSEINEKCKESIRILEDVSKGKNGKHSFTLLDNYAVNGACFNFDTDSLSTYLTLFLSSLILAYRSVLSPALLADSDNSSISAGLSEIRFERRRAVNYLLRRTLLASIESARLEENAVEASMALDYSLKFLTGIRERYNDFFNREVYPLYKETTKHEGEIAAVAGEALKKEIENLRENLEKVVLDPSLPLPEREAILALLLGQDNGNIRGVQYDRETLFLDDGMETPVNLYIDTFNKLAPESGLLPLRGSFPSLVIYEWDSVKEKYIESEENKKAFYPLPDIKRLKMEIQNSSAYIRRKTDELKDLENLNKRKEEETADDKVGDNKRQFDIKEQPLERIYTPSTNLKAVKAVDLRPFFSPVKNQGSLGSCTSFATVSIYEYLINRHSRDLASKANLSEKFVYYFSNVITGKPEGGSNFYEQLAVLGQHGVCVEDLYGYSDGAIGAPPSEEAIKNAGTHRVVESLQIPLCDSGSVTENMKENHRLITTALTEGYPVGISLKIYDNFGKNSPFINRPDEEDQQTGGEGFHAMVIVGYSEAEKCYIVRNSWGTDFGDKGYCYISFAYIDDPAYNSFACIITKTTDSVGDAIPDLPQTVVSFDATENEIKSAVIRNTLDGERIRLEEMQREYGELYRYYQQLLQQIGNPSVRKYLREEEEKEKLRVYQERKYHYELLQEAMPDKKRSFKQKYIKNGVISSLVALLLCALSAIWYSLDPIVERQKVYFWVFCGVIVVIAVVIWCNYIWAKRNYWRNLQEEADEAAVNLDRARRSLLETHLRYHVAGIWIDEFHSLSVSLQATYQKLVKFNDALREIYKKEYQNKDKYLTKAENFGISLYDTASLNTFYETEKKKLISEIDLTNALNLFENNNLNEEELCKAICSRAEKTVSGLFDTFTMADYLCSMKKYDYLPPAHTEKIIEELQSLGQPSTRCNSDESSTSAVLTLMHTDSLSQREWRKIVSSCFTFMPSEIDCPNPDIMILITLRKVPLESLI